MEQRPRSPSPERWHSRGARAAGSPGPGSGDPAAHEGPCPRGLAAPHPREGGTALRRASARGPAPGPPGARIHTAKSRRGGAAPHTRAHTSHPRARRGRHAGPEFAGGLQATPRGAEEGAAREGARTAGTADGRGQPSRSPRRARNRSAQRGRGRPCRDRRRYRWGRATGKAVDGAGRRREGVRPSRA